MRMQLDIISKTYFPRFTQDADLVRIWCSKVIVLMNAADADAEDAAQ